MDKVVLVGYMGSGKSILAKMLSERLNILHLDLDEMIEKKMKMPLKSIFSKKGELFFRKIEHQLFSEVMESEESFVLSTGGGTPCYYNNHKFLKGEKVVSIYLNASVETLRHRLDNEREYRPLLSKLSDVEMKEFIAKHLFERSYFYHQAQHTIAVDNKSLEDILLEIEILLKKGV